MSMLLLRNMSPPPAVPEEHGRTATLVVSLVAGPAVGADRLPPLPARNLPYAVRAACDLLGETLSTRIAAVENYARACATGAAAGLRLIRPPPPKATGGWRCSATRALLQPLEATGAVLFHDGEGAELRRGAVDARAAQPARLDRTPAGRRPLRHRVHRQGRPGAGEPDAHGQRRAGRAAVGHAARLPGLAAQGTAAELHLGRRPDQASDRQRPAEAVAAALLRRLVRDRARHGDALDAQRAGAGQRLRRRADRHHRAGACGAHAGGRHQLSHVRGGRRLQERWSSHRRATAIFHANPAFLRLARRGPTVPLARATGGAVRRPPPRRRMLGQVRADSGPGAADKRCRCATAAACRCRCAPAGAGARRRAGLHLHLRRLRDFKAARGAHAPGGRCRASAGVEHADSADLFGAIGVPGSRPWTSPTAGPRPRWRRAHGSSPPPLAPPRCTRRSAAPPP